MNSLAMIYMYDICLLPEYTLIMNATELMP